MKAHFIERLIAGSVGEESSITIRPAITPDVLPESFHLPGTFYLPEQQFMHSPLESRITSDSESPTKDFAESASKTEAPLPEKVAERMNETTPLKDIQPADDVHVRDVEAKDTERKEQMPTPAQKDIHISKFEAKEHPTEEEPREARISDLEYISSEPEKSYEEKQTAAENVRSHMPTSKHLQSPPSGIVIPEKPVEQTQMKLSLVRPKTYSPMSLKESQERSPSYSEPTVTINIGRIDVRAIMPQKPSTKTRAPALSLKDYLKQRAEGR